MIMPKLCKDCKYYQKSVIGHLFLTDNFDKCLRPAETNYVTGRTNKETCKEERGYSFNCGREGKYWVEKDD